MTQRADTFDNLLALCRAVVSECAEHMAVDLTETSVDITAEAVAYALDEDKAVRLLNPSASSPIAHVAELAAVHVRTIYFVQVGIALGASVGYNVERNMDVMQRFATMFEETFVKLRPERHTELLSFPPVATYVREILASGFSFADIGKADDGSQVEQWWLAQYHPDDDRTYLCHHRDGREGAAIRVTNPDGVVMAEEYIQHGTLHRCGAPALIRRDEAGSIVCARYFDRGLEVDGASHA